MNLRIKILRLSIFMALVVGMLAALVGLFGFNGISAVSAQTDTTAPTVSSVAITSDPDENDADLGAYMVGRAGGSIVGSTSWASGVYRIGDDVRVTVTFSENVTVNGSPQLELAIGSNNRTARYERADGSAVVFRYAVAEGDSDSDGIAINANKLTLNGGSIKDGANNDASLSHNALAAQAGHEVDGVRPRLKLTASDRLKILASSGGTDGAYTTGEELIIRGVFTEEGVRGSVTGPPRVTLNFDGGETREAKWDASLIFSPAQYPLVRFFSYVVQKGDLASDGPSISANSVVLNEGFIRDAAGNDAVLTHEAVEAGTHFIVDAVAPTVSSIAITSDPGDDDTYGSGDKIEVTVTFSEKMSFPISISCGSDVVHCEAELELAIGGTARTAAYQSHDGAEAIYAYTVQAGDSDDDGISIGADKLTGQRITDAAGRLGEGINDADLSHDAVAADSGHKVDGGSSSALTVSGDVTITMQENRPTYVASYEVSGRNGSLTWSLTGDDSDDFTISGGLTGRVDFNSSPNFEDPADTDADNEYEFTVNASDDTNDAYLPVTVVVTNERHDADELPVITGTAQVGETLTVDTSPIPDTDENTTFGYAWKRTDGDTDTFIDGANGTTSAFTNYTMTADDEGKTIKVAVTFWTTAGERVSLTSAPTEPITAEPVAAEPNNPATGTLTISGTAQVGETLTAHTSGISDANGLTNVSYSYQWIRNDGNTSTEIAGETASTYTLVSSDEGKTIKVRVTFTDDGGNEEMLTSVATAAVAAAPPPPPDNVRAVTQKDGTVELTWEAPQDATVTGYRIERSRADENRGGQRRSDGSPRDNHTLVEDTGSADTDYTDESAEKGVEYEYQVSARNEAGAGEASGWVRAGPESASNSPATGAPTISGTAQVGETLRADTTGIADTDGLDNVSFSYQWLADDADIAGATGSTYTPVDGDEGKAIKVQVSFTDDAGNDETLTSPATDAVAAAPQPNIAITSDPDDDDSTFAFWYDEGVYGIGDDIEVTVTFNGNVTVTGSPRLELTIGSSAKNAAYKSVNGSKVVFGYTVAVGDNDTDGIAIGSNKLTLNGGSIRDAADNAANLSHGALSAQSGHKVDGIRPTITYGPSFVYSTFSNDGVHTIGEYISADVRFSEEVIGIGVRNDGRPRLRIDMGGATRYARYHPLPINDWRDERLHFLYEVVKGDLDLDGISVAANSVELNGGTIRDAAGNDAVLTHSAVPADDNFIVDGVPPTVSSVTITSDPGDDDTYGVWDTIEVTVTFSEAVDIPQWGFTENGMTVTRMPRLELNIGGVAKSAKTHERENITGTAIVFRYTVQNGDNDSNGISISANKLTLNGGTIRDANGTSLVGGNPADLTHTAVADDADHKVDTTAGPQSADATLYRLTLRDIVLEHDYSYFYSGFRPAVVNYTASVANSVTQTTVTATTRHSSATYAVKLDGVTDADGVVPLSVGSNVITIKVTAQDGETTKTYTVIVTRAELSTDATLRYVRLSGMDIGAGLGEGAYAQTRSSFTASVYNSVTQTTVTPTPNHSAASYVVKLGGVTDADGVIPLAVGSNVITIEVTAEDGQTTKTYTATVNRATASAPTTGELATDDPPVNFRTVSYTHEHVYLAYDNPRNRGITGHVAQRYKHDGDDFVSAGTDGRYEIQHNSDIGGYNSSWTFTEPEPDTLYKWVVQLLNSQNATVIETSLSVRTPPEPGSTPLSSDATLSDLTLSGIDFDATDFPFFDPPGFDETVTSYVGSVANSVTQTTVTATTRHSSATYAVKLDGVTDADGTVSLAVGSNVITVEVTAEDGETTRTYTITVTRVSSDASTDATLRRLVLSDVDYGTFLPNTTTYTAQVANDVSETLVTPYVSYQGASYVVKLGGVTDINRRISLAVGSNVITVEVTAEDLVTTKIYTITVTRAAVSAAAPDLVVSSVSIDSSTFGDPSFTLHATVRNQGSGSSDSTTLRYYISFDSTITSRDVEIGTDAVGGLAASGSSAESIDLIAPSAPGTFHYGACVDTLSDELETTNNCSSVAVSVNVADPNSLATGAPIINGTAQVGQTLTADTSGIADSDGLTNVAYSYQWLADDTEIAGATGNTYALTSAELGKAIKVRVSFTDGAGNDETLTSTATEPIEAQADGQEGNSPATGLPTISGTAQVGETLTAGITGIADADGLSGESFTYQWVSGDGTTDTDIENATGATYKLVDADQGKAIKVRVTFTDGGGNEETLTSAPTGPVWGDGRPGAPRNLAATPGNKEVTLSWDPPADNGNAPATGYRIEWRVDGKDYENHWGTARSTTYTTNVNANLANGVKYFFRVKAGNGSGNSQGPYGPASGEVSATPTSGSAVDLGTPVLSNTENLHHGMVRLDWEDVEDAGWYVVQYYHVKGGEWLDLPAEGVDIAFHGSSAVVSNLHGLSWLRVGAMSCGGESEWSQIEQLFGTNASDWEGVPVPEVAEGDEIEPCPVVLGTPVLSDTETLHHGMVRLDWEDIEDAGWYVVQYYHVKGGEWLDLPAEGVDIAFHGSSAVVSNLHGLSWLRVRAMSCAGESEWSQIEQLFGTNASDWDGVPGPEVAEGDEIEPCSEDADTSDNSPATGAPTITGTAQVGETLTADTSDIADANGLSNVQHEYQWLADDAEIAGATGSAYTLVDDDEGKAIKVRVSFTDDADNDESMTSAATDAVAAAATPNSPATGAPTISGTAQVGETLTTNASGIADADGLSNVQYEYQWLADDAEIAGATNATYTLTDSDEGKAVKVEVSFTDDAGNHETLTSEATDAAAAAQTNSPATGAPTISGTAQVGETLTADTSGIADADGLSNVQYEYQWLADDADISGATNATYTLAAEDEGKAIKVEVSFTDDADNEETLTSAGTDAAAAASTRNSPATGVPTISGTAQVGETLTADTSGIADADGMENAAVAFYWGTYDNATGQNLLRMIDSEGTYTIEPRDVGMTIHVHVTFEDDRGNVESTKSAPTDTVKAAPTINSLATGAPTISGTAQVGETLTANTSGIADADGLSSVQYEYQWLADDTDISGATNATYTLTDSEESKAITVQVSFTDDADNKETLTSAATDAVAAAPQTNSPATGAPTIAGTSQVGQTLTADTSGIADADGLANATFSYQWLADDTEIAGATGLTYTLIDSEESKAITVQVSFTDDRGHQETLTSAATEAVSAAPTPNSPATGAPAIGGTAQVGETLTANTSGIADADGLSNVQYEYQWFADDAEIAGATGLTYTLADADEGKAIKVEVSFTDDADNEESLTSAATAVVAAEPSEPPDKPKGLEATASHGQVVLTWDNPQDDSITGYVILRRVRENDEGGEFSELVADTGTAATTYTDAMVAASTTYTYRIKAINGVGTSERSRWVHIDTPAPPVPDKPTGLSATAAHDAITLTWDNPGDDSITGYVILRRNRDDDPKGHFDELVADTGSAATTYTDDTVEANTNYTYRIKAINEHGVSQRSRWRHISTPAAP